MSLLRKYLDQSRQSQDAFAERVGVTQGRIAQLINDDGARPSLSLAMAIERETSGVVPAKSWVPVKPRNPEKTTPRVRAHTRGVA